LSVGWCLQGAPIEDQRMDELWVSGHGGDLFSAADHPASPGHADADLTWLSHRALQLPDK